MKNNCAGVRVCSRLLLPAWNLRKAAHGGPDSMQTDKTQERRALSGIIFILFQ